ncbi:MAG TPA: hypothetical protein VHN79_04310 [Lacunisphaera sp.]|nr:hypothetical protein [Lacunisphaera sp.]
MHDFIRSLAFSPGRALLLPRFPAGGWVQRGIMRSFGEDDVVAPYLSSPRPATPAGRKSKTRNRK